MAGKGRNSVRIETEIEKSREESNWKRVIELAEQLKSRNTTKEPLCNFLLGEGRLESFLDECPPIEANISKARSGLNEAKRCLLNAASEQGKKAGVALDSHLLLGKLHYAMGVWEESLSHYNEADLQSLTEKSLPSRSLRIVAESFAIKGLCLEKVPPPTSSKFKQVEWEGEVGHCFELAGDLALLYLQEQDKLQQQVSTISSTSSTGSHSPQPINTGGTRHMGPILETAIQRAPLLHVQAGRLPQAVATYRNMLCAVESSGTHGLRLALTRQLAELLLRGFTGTRYAPPTAQGQAQVSGQKKTVSTGSPWKPRLYTGLNLFVPRNECEEIILLLLISEAMAVRDAVLSQSPEFKEARIRALSNAITIYDLLSVTLMRWGQAALLHESLERALKFSFEEGHVWLQQALCLESMGRHLHAIAVIKEVVRLLPHKVTPCLIAARISYLHLNQLKEGVEWAQKALSRELAQPQNLLSRCHLMVGIGAHYAAMTGAGCHLKQEKQRLHQLASDSLHKAQQCDPNDHLTYYYLALNLGSRGHVTEAVANARAALKLCPEHSPSLHLLVLLLSAQKQLIEARSLLDSALQDFPDNLNLHYVKAYLELAMEGGEVALLTGKHMLALWKTLYEEQTNQTAAGSADHRLTVCDPTIGQNNAASSANADSRSVFQLYTSEMSDKDSSSLHGAHSLAASRVEQALSEVASSISGSQVGGPLGGGARTGSVGSQRAWQLQLHIWLLLAEIYLAMDQLASAVACLHEATNIFPLSHHIMYTRGLVHEQKHEFVEAKQCYQNAVSINPNHIKSLQHLGLMHHYLGSHRLAEKTLRDAAKIDPHAPDTWYNLGKVLEALGDCSRASDCMATALQVEMAAPILPYTTIPMVFD